MRLNGFALTDYCEHRLTHGLCPADSLVSRHPTHGARNQFHSGVRVDGPMQSPETSLVLIFEEEGQELT